MTGPTYQPAERRPIASRDLTISRRAATWLAARGVSPNAISLAGMFAAIAGGLLLAATSWLALPGQRLAWLAGAGCAQLRLLANMFDGMVAVESGKASPVGELYNEVPDRVSDAAILIGLGYAAGGSVAAGFVAALAAVFTAYVRAMAKVVAGRQDFSGPLAKPQRMAVVTLVAVYCGLTPAAWQWSWPEREGWGLPAAALLVIVVGSLLTATGRLRRCARDVRRQP